LSLFLIVIITNVVIYAKDFKYPVFMIPDSLKQNAVAVIRNYETSVFVYSPENMNVKVTRAVTVLNLNGDDYGSLELPYDTQCKIIFAKATIYDATGIEIKTFNQSDFYDYSPYDNTMYSDSRILKFKYVRNQYPYTVEYQYEYTYKGFLSLPNWLPIENYNVSVQTCKYTITIPNDYIIKTKQYNFSIIPDTISGDPKSKSLCWLVKDIKPIESEPYMPEFSEVFPFMRVVPEVFAYDGYYGSNASWKDLGSWRSGLITERDVIPVETYNEIKSMTDSIDDLKEKVKVIYCYLQKRTRYFNISFGIGGYQPIPAALVDKNGYGDCKALSNYTKSLLKALGINSYYTIISTNSNFDTTIVCQQSNHVILCVPVYTDTIWLECTNQTFPFNYLGNDMDGKYALLITEDGGKIVKTPCYTRDQNGQFQTAQVFVMPDGNASALVKTHYCGLQYDYIFGFNQLTIDEQKKELYEDRIDIPSFVMNKYEYTEDKNENPSAILNLDLSLNSYATINSKRMFLPLNLMNKWVTVEQMRKERTFPIYRKISYYDADTINYTIPEGYTIEFLPKNTLISGAFGEYSAQISFSNNVITYIRSLKMNKGTFPPEMWVEYSGFLKAIQTADNAKAVLVKNL
jgi:hypothetical protein